MMKSFLTKSMTALAALVLVFSCTKTQVVELTVSPLAVSMDATGGEKSVAITCNDVWNASCDADWITLSAASGEGNGSLKITASASRSLEIREASVTVSAGELKKTVKVSQVGMTAVVNVSPYMKDISHEGETFDLSITSNLGWTISIPASATWITADKTSGDGNGTVKITVAPNESTEAREAEIKVVGDPVLNASVYINQAGVPLFLNVKTEKVDATSEGGSFPVEIEANQAWTVTVPEDADWLTAEPLSGEGNATVTLTIEENIYRKGRTATLVFTAGEDSVELPVVQDLAPASRQTDSLALVAIYVAADGANWKEERRWDLSKTIDQWDGVKLTDGRVSQVAITAAGVISSDWELPSEIGDLSELSILKFNQCKLTGAIPDEVYGLANLTELWLQNNNVQGTLSEKLGQLTNLKNLYIDRNTNLGGVIPATIGQLKNLVNINISKTGIGGAIPTELVGCTALVNFMAYENQLSGEVPDIWDQFENVGIIQLYGNPGLVGSLPASCGRATTTAKNYSLRFDGCNFTGNIPESYATLPSVCKQFWAKNNKLSGVVPAGVQAHANWNNWKAADNILPQQEGYGLKLTDATSLEGTWQAPRSSEQPNDIALVLNFSSNNLTLYIIAWGMRFEGTYTYANETVSYAITGGYQALSDVHFDADGKMDGYSWWAGNLDPNTLQLTEGFAWYDITDSDNPFNEIYLEYKESLASFDFKVTGENQATSSQIVIPDVTLTKVK